MERGVILFYYQNTLINIYLIHSYSLLQSYFFVKSFFWKVLPPLFGWLYG